MSQSVIERHQSRWTTMSVYTFRSLTLLAHWNISLSDTPRSLTHLAHWRFSLTDTSRPLTLPAHWHFCSLTLFSHLTLALSQIIDIFGIKLCIFFFISNNFESESQSSDGESILNVVSDTECEMSDKCQWATSVSERWNKVEYTLSFALSQIIDIFGIKLRIFIYY